MIHDMGYYRYYEVTEEGVQPKGGLEEKVARRLKTKIQQIKPEVRRLAQIQIYEDSGHKTACVFINDGKKTSSTYVIYEHEEDKINLSKLISIVKKDPLMSKYYKGKRPIK